jgi:hypothetical protein
MTTENIIEVIKPNIRTIEVSAAKGTQGDTGGIGLTGDTGDTGATGADGSTVLSGLVPPEVGDGVDGDFWIDVITSIIYGPKASGAWPAGVNLKGGDGSDGSDGSDGIDGVGVPAGGTTGQHLTKIDATDHNTEWTTPATPDVEEAPIDGSPYARQDTGWVSSNSGVTFTDITETVHVATTVDVDPADGNIQVRTLAGNETPTYSNISTGQSVLIKYVIGAFILTLTNIPKWTNDGTAPSSIAAEHWLVISNVDGTIVGTNVGGVS